MIRHLTAIIFSAPLVVFGAWSAQAAPQVLGLVATAAPVDLQCDRVECSAEFTTICLQQRRASPAKGQRYLIHDLDAMTAMGVTESGERVRVALDERFTIVARRGHSAIRVSAPAKVLRQMGLEKIAITVEENVALVPEATAGDKNPLTPEDIEIAAGPLLQLAGEVLEGRGEKVEAARMAARLVNALPLRGRASDEVRDGVWQATFGTAAAEGEAAEMARQSFDLCHRLTRAGRTTLRDCMGTAHDILIGRVNNEYWDKAGAGS